MTQPGQPGYDPTVNDWGQGFDAAERRKFVGIDETVTGGAFAAVRDKAWHNLGVVTAEQVSAAELLKLAHADYEVHKGPSMTEVNIPLLGADGQPMTYVDPNTHETMPYVKTVRAEDPTRANTWRQHPETGAVQILGNVSAKYNVKNNLELFVGFADALMDAAEPTVATCGVLYEGRQAFMCWKLPKGILVGGVDAMEWWMLAHTSHDGSRPGTIAITPRRTVCRNTCRYNLANAITRWSIRHTANSNMKFQEAREALGLTWKYAEQFGQVADGLIEAKMTTAEFERIIEREFGPQPKEVNGVMQEPGDKARESWDEKKGQLLYLFNESDTQANVRRTAWAGVQAVGEWYDWKAKVQVGTFTDPDAYRLWRSLDGDKSVTLPKERMLHVVRDYAGV